MGSVERLISIVQKYPILYDQSNPDYKKLRAKDKLWTKIGKELNENGEELKKKWKNLRDTYAKYIKSTKTKTGKAATKRKKWVWAHHMEAFRPFLTCAVEVSAESVTVNEDDDSEAGSTQIHFENNTVDDSDSEPQDVSQSPCLIPSVLELSDVATPTAYKEPTKEKIQTQPSTSGGDMIQYFEKKRKREHDAIDSLLLAHAKTIKTFSGRRQVITKMKIAKVIMEQELLHQDELASSSQQNNSISRPDSAHSYYVHCSTSSTPSP